MGMNPLVAQVPITTINASTEQFTLRLLADSDVPLQLSKLFADETLHLEALGRALNADSARSFLIRVVRGEKESFLLTTPRHRVSFFEDRYDPHTVILKSVEQNTFYRWENERKRGVPCNVVWTTGTSRTNANVVSALGRTRKIGSKIATVAFWEFWGSLLAKEREALQNLVDLPGWAYSKRRIGTNGGIEFKVGDDRDEIIQKCGNTFLVEIGEADGKPNKGGQFLLFDVLHSEAGEWIAAAPRKSVDPSRIPKDGNIRIDWIGVKTELKRRQEALDRLGAGKAVHPGLAEMLPDGPTSSLPLTAFTPILLTPYNVEQIDAVSKALAPGSLTSILGPPGTGKTSVIAEIAAQLASTGKRVLISAQSNLAVDNALEKVTEVESIFAVRIGRPESVKLNPELLLDKSSARYRDRLLVSSARAEESMAREVCESLLDLPSESLLSIWLDQWIHYSRAQIALASAQKVDDLRQDRCRHAASALSDAELLVQRLSTTVGISVADFGHLVEVSHALETSGISAETAYINRTKITFAHTNRAAIANINNKLASLAKNDSEKTATMEEIKRTEGYILDWSEKDKFIWQARRENQSHAVELSSAGFFKKLWLGITGPPHNLADLESKLATAKGLRDEAEKVLPSRRNRLKELSQMHDTETEECKTLVQRIFGRRPLAVEIQNLLNDWNRDLDLARKVVAAGALPYLHIINRCGDITNALSLLKKAISEDQAARAGSQQSLCALSDAKKGVDAAIDSRNELVAVAKLLHLTPPAIIGSKMMNPDFTDADASNTDDFFTALRARRNEIAMRGECWPAIQQALSQYHTRLNQTIVDLQRAVLSEANVIGATCSGIAGTKDFDCDFDCVIVDEAGRTTPLDLLMPIVRGMSIVLVGDHKQLPPFIGDTLKEELNDIEKKLIERSIFESIYESSHGDRRQALRKQYRMAPAICEVVREISYKDDPSLALETAGEALNRKHTIPGLGAIHWSQPAGPKNTAESLNGKHGLVNKAEVEATVSIFKKIAAHQSRSAQYLYSIGIISMYKQQSQAIERRLEKISQNYPSVQLEIGTVDSFQGREKDAIILGFSETNPNRRRFFYDRRRLNVALSRARELLVIVGNLDKLGASRVVFGVENPLFELRFLIESGIGVCSSKEVFNA